MQVKKRTKNNTEQQTVGAGAGHAVGAERDMLDFFHRTAAELKLIAAAGRGKSAVAVSNQQS